MLARAKRGELGTVTAASIPVDLKNELSGFDQASSGIVACAIRHVNSQRPDHVIFSRT